MKNGNFQRVNYLPFISLVLLFLMGLLLFLNFYDSSTSLDNARYLLSAEAQTQAAIIAITITLTLIAIQLSAQSYSNRVFKVFVNEKFLWVLLFLYAFSISYDLLILSLISENIPYLEVLIGTSLFLIVVAIFALFPYTRFVIDKLDSKVIINDLRKQIDKKELSNEIRRLVQKEPITFESINEETLIRPIVDIIKTSIIKRDPVTARDGIIAIKNIAIQGLNKDKLNLPVTKIMNYFFWHIREIWEVVLQEKDALTAIEVLRCIKDIIGANKNTLDSISYWPLVSYWYGEMFLDSLFNTAKRNKWDQFLKENIDAQIELARAAGEFDLENSFGIVCSTLGEIGLGIECGDYPYSHFVYNINKVLGEFAELSASKKWEVTMAENFERITKTSRFIVEKTEIVVTAVPLENLENVAKILIKNDFYDDGWWKKAFERYLMEESYGEIACCYAREPAGPSLGNVLESIERIGLLVINSKHNESIEHVIRTLEYIASCDLEADLPNIDLILNVFETIKRESKSPFRETVTTRIETAVKGLIEDIIEKVVKGEVKEDRTLEDYCHDLIFIRNYGYDTPVRKVLVEYEDSFLGSEKEQFKALKNCYEKILLSSQRK